MGCANQAGEDNRNVARMGVLLAGFPQSVAAVTFNRLCASGLNAVNMAARAIKAGEGDVYIAGGVESMSRGPYAVPKSANGWPVGNVTAWDSSFGWRFPNPRLEALFPLEAMGETAENIQEQVEPRITREEQDAFAYESQRRAVEAINTGRFRDEIAPVSIPQRKGDPVIVAHDEHPRYHWEGETAVLETSPQQLAKLRPVFRAGGTVTAGNASGLNDGAAALLLMSAEKAAALGLQAAGPLGGERGGGRRSAHDGPRPDPGHAQGHAARRAGHGGLRPGGTQRGVRGAIPGRDARLGPGPGDHQRQRRRDRAGASAGLLRGAHPDHPAP